VYSLQYTIAHCPAKSNSIGDDNNREHLAADDVVPT